MFKNIFSFEGRIRRTEFGISYIVYIVFYVIVLYISEAEPGAGIVFLAMIPLLWFLWAQGAKRCHDIGKSGWWQIVPFYVLWMLFQGGDTGENGYGDDPKNRIEFGAEDYVAPSILADRPDRPADDETDTTLNNS